ncbi:MAG: VanZ family protein [Bacteroidales bacterium]|nr:VanZ family protein [Bacteroidales bacterium]OQB71520.1 MAG: VanZ like family protein [Bacteroidetes bacterium ADurb.Bin139]MDD4435702.1 VanZ family protein [Bacteroidales bacterium]MDD5732789.1 VanZ family protein [Bacteroidales bacterium]HOG24601.1 VanZ family protein [Bacteroidales bacterium]
MIFLLVAYLGGCTYLLFVKGDSLPELKKSGAILWLASLLGVMPDKVIHAVLFIPIIPLTWGAVRPRRGMTKVIILWSGLIFGAITEIIQHYLPYRTGNISDLAADIFGSVLGVPFLLLFFSGEKTKRK